MKLNELIDPALLAEMVDGGYIRTQVHPDLPLTIYNYSEKAQFERIWNLATRQCRGLIVDDEGVVVARPFRKFFNYGENADVTAVLEPGEPITVSDKMDGSLGILFFYAGDWHVATRGSFTSDQAFHATALFRERYSYLAPAVAENLTLLFEIIYPDNRIVVDYGQHDELVLLGAVNIETGKSVDVTTAKQYAAWRGPGAKVFGYASLGEALAAEPRPNAEGLVVHGWNSDERIKIKQEDYVALHRIVTGLSTRTVWEHLGEDKPLNELLEPLPEEFHDWVREVAEGLFHKEQSVINEVYEQHGDIALKLPEGWTRKDYALLAREYPNPGYLFLMLDSHLPRLRKAIWRDIKPERVTLPPGMNQHTEDTA